MGNEDGYFLGSIICINATTDAINAPKFEVVDGQQRLTTISLFLAALFTKLNAVYQELDEEQQADVLQLKRKLVLKKTQSDTRVIPQSQNSTRQKQRVTRCAAVGCSQENGKRQFSLNLPDGTAAT